MKHVFIVGSKGIPNQYGGFETFVDKLTEYKKSDDIMYHVSAIKDSDEYNPDEVTYECNGAHCFNIKAGTFGLSKNIANISLDSFFLFL